MELQGKTIVVTGATRGLGEAIVRLCHREGANVGIVDIHAEGVVQLADELGERALGVACDLRRDNDLAGIVDRVTSHFGRIDGLVNNAGVNFVKPFLETSAPEWDDVIAIDLRAVFLLTQSVCRWMLSQRPQGGSIVNITSVHTRATLPGASPYAAAKSGVVGMTRSIAVEMANKHIRVNCISPGLLNTQIWDDIQKSSSDSAACVRFWLDHIPIERIIEPKEIGEIAVFLLSDRSTCITGANIFADGGMTSQLISKERYPGATE